MLVEEVKTRFVTLEGIRFEIQKGLTIDDISIIERIVCDEYNINKGLYRSHYKEEPYPDARKISWFIMHHIFGQNKAGIARYFERNHTSIITGLRTMKSLIDTRDEKIMPHFINVLHALKNEYKWKVIKQSSRTKWQRLLLM